MRKQIDNPLVKRHKAAVFMNRQGKQISIRRLSVSHQKQSGKNLMGERQFILPKMMLFQFCNRLEMR